MMPSPTPARAVPHATPNSSHHASIDFPSPHIPAQARFIETRPFGPKRCKSSYWPLIKSCPDKRSAEPPRLVLDAPSGGVVVYSSPRAVLAFVGSEEARLGQNPASR